MAAITDKSNLKNQKGSDATGVVRTGRVLLLAPEKLINKVTKVTKRQYEPRHTASVIITSHSQSDQGRGLKRAALMSLQQRSEPAFRMAKPLYII